MRGKVSLSLLASALVVNAMAADDLAGMFKEGKASGQLRAFFIDRDYDGYSNATSVHRNATAVGGYLKYDTGAWNGVSLGAAFYTSNGLFLKDKCTTTGMCSTLLPDLCEDGIRTVNGRSLSIRLYGEAHIAKETHGTIRGRFSTMCKV